MTTANKVTILRILLIPVFIILLMIDETYANTLALIIFIIASITDSVDGYIARKYNQVTNLGKFMDPLADKLLVTSAILFFVSWGQMPAWVAMIIIAREFAVTGLRLVAASGGVVLAAGWSGKIKTASSIVAICIMLTSLHTIEIISGAVSLNDVCVAVILITTMWSGVEYFVKNGKVFSEESLGKRQ